jgi:Fibronectin type III domain
MSQISLPNVRLVYFGSCQNGLPSLRLAAMFPKPLPGIRSDFEGRPKRPFLRATLLSGILFLAAASAQAAQSVTLAWASSSGPNLAGYRVHEGTSSGTYTQTLDVGNRTTATISNLTAGVTYHFVVSAYNAAGVESAYSNEVAFTAPGVLPFNFVPGRDLVWRNTATGQVGLWIMNGTKIAQSPIIGSASLDWQIIGTGNFTGNPGILWVNSNTGQLGVWSVNGDATPGVATFSVGGSGVAGTVQAIGNFSGSASSDLIVHDSQTGGTWMATNQGSLRFSTSFLGWIDPRWKIVGVADLAATGTPQLIWQNASTGQLSVWFFSNGSLVASPIMTTIPAPGWKITAFGAVNGPGKADIVWQNRSSGAVGIWETDGQNLTSIESPGDPGPPGAPWQLNGIAYLNSSEAGQIIWRNTFDGSVWTWNVNGNSFSTVKIATAPTEWVIQPNQPVSF